MVARPGRGFAFGEIALVTDEPRAATIRATGATTCVVISRQDFQEEALQGEIGALLQAKMQEYKREAARKKRAADEKKVQDVTDQLAQVRPSTPHCLRPAELIVHGLCEPLNRACNDHRQRDPLPRRSTSGWSVRRGRCSSGSRGC